MRVLILSKACIVGQYQTKLTALAAKSNLQLTVVVPPTWRDERGIVPLENRPAQNFEMIVAPIRFNGHFHLHYYPTFPDILEHVLPDILHIDEEPYNFATFHALHALRRIAPKSRVLFFSWQNLVRRYPPPFAWMEQYVYRHVNAAIAGSSESQRVLRRKGFQKPIAIIPQFGVPNSFAPRPSTRGSNCRVVGYAGRLVREKGIQVLLHALANVNGDWQLRLLGSGPALDSLQALARELGIAARVQFIPWISSSEMPNFYNSLDVLVVPSLTRPNWKEQFGRVLMEAMACGVPVIGSASGEIPNVISDAGILIPENDAPSLARALADLLSDPTRRQQLGALGRARALANFSERRVVDDTYALYQKLLDTR
ncbi:MAG: glycosyltransferase [Chloroflexi bacterium]|nr:glycosyltransferase [Chloroflexota bacterium]